MENEKPVDAKTDKYVLHTYKTEDVKSITIKEVDSRGGLTSKLPSFVKMSVGHRFAHEAQNLVIDIKEGITPTAGLIGLKLIAVYAEDEAEKILDDMQTDLDLVEDEGE